jgi:ABC-2 type transport system ATP-binding protein
MNDLAIEATQLAVTKGKQPILADVTMRVRKGVITGLIGPSGSGKTTLMRTIIGVQRPTRGAISVLGAAAGTRELRRKIGYVTQTPAVYGDLTVRQNLLYFATLTGASRQDADIIIGKVQLEEQRDQLVNNLSGGQKARVSLAVALLGEPEILVLDEPTVGLDPLLRAELWAMFADLAQTGVSLLISSHVMDEAERCEELVLLREGRVLWNGSRQALLDTTATVTVGDAFIAAVRRKATA